MYNKNLEKTNNPKINNEFGYWESPNANHGIDNPLCDGIIDYFKSKKVETIYDFGCGDGLYTFKLLDNQLDCKGFDGNPFIKEQSNGICDHLNLAEKHYLDKRDYVLCLEVGEHIPKKYELNLIHNLHNHNTKGIILSWAVPGQGGEGHFNEQPNDYIKSIFSLLGYKCNFEWEYKLRKISTLPWFKNTVMVFEK